MPYFLLCVGLRLLGRKEPVSALAAAFGAVQLDLEQRSNFEGVGQHFCGAAN